MSSTLNRICLKINLSAVIFSSVCKEAYLFKSFILISICAFIAFICFMIYAMVGQKNVFLFAKATVWKYIKRVIGRTFIGAGIGLAVSNK